MASRLIKRVLRQAFNFGISGRFFRILAPQSPPAPPGGRHRLAICDLIPHLGDKIMIFPLLDALRQENPDIEISYFTSGAGKLIGLHPEVDHLYCIERRPRKSFFARPFLLDVIRWWWRELRSLRFHTVVVLRGGVEPSFSHHLAWMLGGKTRVAYSPELEPERWESQFRVSPLFTAEVNEIKGVHEVSRGNEVLQLAGLLKEPVDIRQSVSSMVAIAQKEVAQNYLKELGLAGQAYAVIAPGASLPKKAWPAKEFAELAKLELLSRGWLVVIVGGPEIAEAARTIRACLGEDTGLLDLSGKTSFDQLTAVCGGSRCFLGNDSGTSHVAGACGVPTLIVSSFARSGRQSEHASPMRSHPLGPQVGIVQPERQLPPCKTECMASEAHCITQVGVETARESLKYLLASAECQLQPTDGEIVTARHDSE